MPCLRVSVSHRLTLFTGGEERRLSAIAHAVIRPTVMQLMRQSRHHAHHDLDLR